MLGLGAGLLITVTESHWYGISILSGSFFSSLFVLSLFKTLRDKDSNFWIIIASVALGLALWSRPVLLPLIPLGAWFIFSVLRKQRRLDRRVICAAFLPCAFILAMAGMYNYARFDSPFEFGLTYQLSLRNNYSFPVSLSDPFQLIQRVAAALPSILLNPLTFFADSWDFSRRHVSTMPIPPTGDYLLGDPNDLIAGLSWIAPYLLGLPWVLGAKLKVWEYDQYRLANAMIFTGIGVMVLVANFGFVANRYHLDYLPLIGVGATVLFCQKISFEKGGARRWVYDLVWLVTGIFVSWINFNLI
jgi:hypothetical protein